MLTIVLRILSILGILLVGLLLLAVTMLLLVLFVPITYRISGVKDEEGFWVSAKVKWLLGLVRLQYGYPEPGEMAAKILFLTVYRIKIPSAEEENGSDKADKASKRKKGKKSFGKSPGKDNPSEKTLSNKEKHSSKGDISKGDASADGMMPSEAKGASEAKELLEEKGACGEKEVSEEQASGFGKILQKFEKIKYTIHSLYDKIKEIWNNISYYLELLQEDQTRQLFSHIWMRAGKIIKSVKPKNIKAEILFGTGSPDTTGYLYGVYCMFSPKFGKGVCMTPDFEKAQLEADFTVSGHITVWILAVNACKIALDKRLWRLIKKAASSPGIKAVRKKAA